MLEWQLGDNLPSLRLSSGSADVPISETDTLYFNSDGWSDEESAMSAAVHYIGALARTFARLRVGVDYGDRAPGDGGFSDWLIQKFWDEHGVRVINEQSGVMVYETHPPPVFGGSSGSVALVVTRDQFEVIFDAALKDYQPLSVHERVSVALYNAAFFEDSQDARFLLSMMALEALIEPADRSAEARTHVDHLIAVTRESELLTRPDKDSFCGALIGLKRQSIGQAGRAFVSQLTGRKYAGMDPIAFFSHCYALRSRLVHGDAELPSRGDVGLAAASLEVMMSDLLAGSLREIPLSAAVSG